MQAILIENDALGWFESGPVRDVTIRNNVFEDCAYNSYPGNYVIHVSPGNTKFLPTHWVHENIKIENNLFKVHDYPISSVKITSGLVFKNNQVVKSAFKPPGEKRPGILLTGSTKVEIKNNRFELAELTIIELNRMKKRDIRSDIEVTTK